MGVMSRRRRDRDAWAALRAGLDNGVALMTAERPQHLAGRGVMTVWGEALGIHEGVRRIAVERQRQVRLEGHTPHDDDVYVNGELATAASCYAVPPTERGVGGYIAPGRWPWATEDWKPSPDDRIKELAKAGALIAAEIDRLVAAGRAGERGLT